MNETCKAIENLKEIVKMFIEAQTEVNDLNNGDFEKLESKITELEEKLTELEEKLTELDFGTTIVFKDLAKRVMILEEKVKRYESQNVREDINKINDKMIRINKKHTTEINDVQHRLNIIEKERRRNNAPNK